MFDLRKHPVYTSGPGLLSAAGINPDQEQPGKEFVRLADQSPQWRGARAGTPDSA